MFASISGLSTRANARTWDGGDQREGGHRSAGPAAWNDYQIIIWQPQTPARLAGLARLGVTAGMILGQRERFDRARIPQQTAPFLALGLRWYIENIATDFYAAYHRWRADRPVTALFDEAKRLHRREPSSIDAFVRTPSLSDPSWMRRIAVRLGRHVRAYKHYHPLFYDLADEAGIADLAAAWDFDFGRKSLSGMRVWLRRHYRHLTMLNREWGTHFNRWRAVMPMTTDAALTRAGDNFAAWADFKAWMNVAFAHAVRAGTDAVHAADPRARAGLEGAQVPGWGGYDYAQLAASVEVMELYDHGNNVEISRSLAPRLITLTTSSLASPRDIHTVWHELLLGGRGLILWDEDNALVDDNGAPTARGSALAALAAELRAGLAMQLITSSPAIDPVAVLYSPASLRTQWLLDRKADGKPWADRSAETEYEDNDVRSAMRWSARMLSHLGVQPRWLTDEMISAGALRTDRVRVLVLPHTIAMSRLAARRIREFIRRGGVVLADTEPGLFDSHSRRLVRSLLGEGTRIDGCVAVRPELWRATSDEDVGVLLQWKRALEQAGVIPAVALTLPDGTVASDVDMRNFRTGGVRIIGLQHDTIEGHGDIVLRFKGPVYIYDLRHPGPPSHASELRLTPGPVAPALVAVSLTPIAATQIKGPAKAQIGAVVDFSIVASRNAQPAPRIVYLEAVSPDGAVAAARKERLAIDRRAGWRLVLARDAPLGNWTIRMHDLLTGQWITRTLQVQAANHLLRETRR